ncbi:PQQ-binding-like beta-propeller repeat protein [Nonomuraea typhae]|uniref:outer membrane protein assembly factor BamB family protein n=1 Tax=Nonomuraea typhae TaxID=2603600 RepID=UPI0012F8AA38|nr:PQQ-binding-like beta-propeller repeat protein [Nonomuraea typhae]
MGMDQDAPARRTRARAPGIVGAVLVAACTVLAGDTAPPLPGPVAWRTAWSLPVGEEPPGPPEPRYGVAEGGLAVVTGRGAVDVHDSRTGRRRYTIAAEAVPATAAWLAGETVVVARRAPDAAERGLAAYDLAGGRLLWRRTVTAEGGIMVSEGAVTILDRPAAPSTITSFGLRTGEVTARTRRSHGCVSYGAAAGRSVALLTECRDRIELVSLDPRTLRPAWRRPLPVPAGPADHPSSGVTAGDDGHLAVTVRGAQSFVAPDGRLLSGARAALSGPPLTGRERWSRPLLVGSYPEVTGASADALDGIRPTPKFLISLETATGRVLALPIATPAAIPRLVGATEDMAFVHDEIGAIVAYELVRGRPGGLPLSRWPDACALLDVASAGLGGYLPGPVRRTVNGALTPKPAGCDWIPAGDVGAEVSVSVAWMFATPGAAREVFEALVGRIKETGRYDPVTETSHALTQSIPLPGGSVSESIVTAGPALVLLRSSSRRVLRSLTPVLQRALLARYEPAATVAEPAPRAGWVFPADEPIGALLVADGRVYASTHAEVHVLDAASGTLRWSRGMGGFVTAGPIPAGGTVYAATLPGRVHALSGSSGRTRWSREIAQASGLAAGRGTVYAWTADGRVIALDEAAGRTRWKAETGDPIQGLTPHVAGELVYVTGSAGVVALDARSGTRRWRFPVDAKEGAARVTVSGGTVYVALADGRLYALDRITGRLAWRFRVATPSFAGLVVSGGDVYAGGGGALHRLDATTGRVRRTFEVGTAGEATTTLAVAGGVAYLTHSGVRVDAVDTATGKLRWTYPLSGGPGWLADFPVPAAGTMYVQAGDGTLHAVATATGTRRWTLESGDAFGTAPVVAGGMVYIGSHNGNLHATR